MQRKGLTTLWARRQWPSVYTMSSVYPTSSKNKPALPCRNVGKLHEAVWRKRAWILASKLAPSSWQCTANRALSFQLYGQKKFLAETENSLRLPDLVADGFWFFKKFMVTLKGRNFRDVNVGGTMLKYFSPNDRTTADTPWNGSL
jgi:hypothetical protein